MIGFIPFPRVLVLCEMQSASSRSWTRVTVSIPYDDNHYTMGTFIHRLIDKVRFENLLSDLLKNETTNDISLYKNCIKIIFT